MSYRKKPFYKKKYFDNNNNGRPPRRKPYFKKRYNRSRSRSRNRSNSSDFNMYNKNEHLSSSSPSESFSNSSYDDNRDEDEYYLDRKKICPFLLRIFYKINSFNSLNLFKEPPFPSELNIYTWEDADLEELAKFIHLALKNTILNEYDYYKFSRIFYDEKGTLLRDEIGCVVINNKSSKLNINNNKTLKDIKFQIGDYLDINITSVNKNKI